MFWIGMTIKRKDDCKLFKQKMHIAPDEELQFKVDNTIYALRTDKDGVWSFCQYTQNLGMLGWVTLELAADNNSGYEHTVDDYIWKYRKYINAFMNKY